MKKAKKMLCMFVTLALLLTSNPFAFASSNAPQDLPKITDITRFVESYFNERGQSDSLEYLRSIMTDKQIAKQIIDKSMAIIRMNEYETVKKFQSTPDSVLKDKGFKEEEIKRIKHLDYKKMAEDYKKLSDKELKAKGFSDEKISALRVYDGSEQALAAVTSDVSIIFWYDLDYCYYSTSANRTYAKVQYNWSWDSYPWGYWSTDMMAFQWSEFMYLTSASYATCQVGYMTVDTNQFITFENQSTIINAPNGSCYFKFPFRKTFTGLVDGYSKNGSGIINVSKAGQVYELGFICSYGHTTGSLGSPTVSFAPAPSLSITFSSSMEQTDPSYIYLSTFPIR